MLLHKYIFLNEIKLFYIKASLHLQEPPKNLNLIMEKYQYKTTLYRAKRSLFKNVPTRANNWVNIIKHVFDMYLHVYKIYGSFGKNTHFCVSGGLIKKEEIKIVSSNLWNNFCIFANQYLSRKHLYITFLCIDTDYKGK